MSNDPLLICSLGGSPGPVRSAIRTRRWEFVLFVVTEKDGAQPGSLGLVPALAAETGLGPDRHATLSVPPDDPDTIFQRVNTEVAGLRGRFPRRGVVFDYTGGTKSMTAAMLQAALGTPGADIQIMAGERADLQQVRPGTERPWRINPDWMRAERRIARYREGWRSFAYAESAAGFAALLDELDTDEQAVAAVARLRDLHALSAAFDAWDRFRHAEARKLLQPLAARHRAFLDPYLRALSALCGPEAGAEPARLADLWHNATRTAGRGRHDDAVARCYRLVEWTAQSRLRQGFGLNTEAMDWSNKALTPAVIARAELSDQQGRRTLSGLGQALKLCMVLERQGALARFLTRERDRELRELQELRNRSILAHGSVPLGETEWQRFRAWLMPFVRDVLPPELARAGIAAMPPQLPEAPPPGL